MAIARVQYNRASGTATTLAVTLAGAPSNNNALIVAVYWLADPGTITPATGFTEAVNIVRGTAQRAYIYYKIAASEGTSWTWSWVNSTTCRLNIWEVSGLTATQSMLLDKTASNDAGAGTGTSVSTGTTAATTI